MSNPIAADVNPIATHLDKGKEYYWCTCGRSKQQPFCDGSHRGTGLEPLRFAAEEAGEVNLCQCKGTRNRPFCDGSHVNFQKGQEVEPPRGADDQMPEPVPAVEEPMVASDESSRGSPTLVVSGCRDALGPSRLMKRNTSSEHTNQAVGSLKFLWLGR
jgi:CDGSH-type Zn-finger protein